MISIFLPKTYFSDKLKFYKFNYSIDEKFDEASKTHQYPFKK